MVKNNDGTTITFRLGPRRVLFLICEAPPCLRTVEQNLSLFLTVRSVGGVKALSRQTPILDCLIRHANLARSSARWTNSGNGIGFGHSGEGDRVSALGTGREVCVVPFERWQSVSSAGSRLIQG